MSDLYDVDILQWSERQAELLRRRAAGELVNAMTILYLFRSRRFRSRRRMIDERRYA